MDWVDRLPSASADGMAAAGNTRHAGSLSGRALCPGNPEVLFCCAKPDTAQARRQGDVDCAGRARWMGAGSGADAITAGPHIDSPDLVFVVVVGEQSAEAVVIRCRKIL